MPLFGTKDKPQSQKPRDRTWNQAKGRRRRWEVEDGSVSPLSQLCLCSLAENMNQLWVKDYAENYMDQYCFRHILGPFSELPGELVEGLTSLLCSRRELSRAALHLLLVPQLRGLSLGTCPGLVTPNLCSLITVHCQYLTSLDISGAQQLSAQTQCDLLGCLPALRSLSLAGTQCDCRVVRVVALRCPALRHLDVSGCPLLTPAGLLPLGGVTSVSSSSPPAPLCSLLAQDIGLGKEEGDLAAAAAYLLLTLPGLERVLLEGLGEACCLILDKESRWTEGFTSREGVCCLEELWRRRLEQGEGRREGAALDEEEEEEEEKGTLWDRDEGEGEDDGRREESEGGEGVSSVQTERLSKGGEGIEGAGTGEECIILSLKEVQGVSASSLQAVAKLCPALRSISLDCEEGGGRSQASLLSAGLQTWAGQLRSLTVRFPGLTEELLPALRCVGSSLASLTLEGVRTSVHTPLLELLHACPRLSTFVIHAEPPLATPREEDEEDEEEEQNDRDGPCLPQLCSLSIHFSHDQRQLRPALSWKSLKGALWCLLSGSLMLKQVSLVAVPCPLNSVFDRVLRPTQNVPFRNPSAAAAASNGAHDPSHPLARLHHLNLAHSDVTGTTAKKLFEVCVRMRSLDLSDCWHVKASEVKNIQHAATRRRQSLTVKWT